MRFDTRGAYTGGRHRATAFWTVLRFPQRIGETRRIRVGITALRAARLLTYVRMSGLRLGQLFNFHALGC
jgi:hypothetical protein